MSVAQEHNSNADGLRGIACLAVFFSHLHILSTHICMQQSP